MSLSRTSEEILVYYFQHMDASAIIIKTKKTLILQNIGEDLDCVSVLIRVSDSL